MFRFINIFIRWSNFISFFFIISLWIQIFFLICFWNWKALSYRYIWIFIYYKIISEIFITYIFFIWCCLTINFYFCKNIDFVHYSQMNICYQILHKIFFSLSPLGHYFLYNHLCPHMSLCIIDVSYLVHQYN